MSKERLEEIEKNLDPLGYGMGGHLISVNDIYWLVGYAKEQAERMQELEQKNDRLKQEADFWRVEDREMMRLSHENKRYREALEFYADEENYEFETIVSDCDIEVVSKVLDDYGQKARKVLEESE